MGTVRDSTHVGRPTRPRPAAPGVTGAAEPAPRRDVIVVGAGISGVACARALEAAGTPVRVLERSGRPGGRMASPPLPRGSEGGDPTPAGRSTSGRRTSPPATRSSSRSCDDWERRGLARPWTDTLRSRDPDGSWSSKSGPTRWAAPGGLRSLVADLAEGLRIDTAPEVASVEPGPGRRRRARARGRAGHARPAGRAAAGPRAARARRLLADRAWNPVIAVALGYGTALLGRSCPRRSSTATPTSTSSPTTATGAATAPRCSSRTPPPSSPRWHLDDPDGVVAPRRRGGHRAARPARRAGVDARAPLELREPRRQPHDDDVLPRRRPRRPGRRRLGQPEGRDGVALGHPAGSRARRPRRR